MNRRVSDIFILKLQLNCSDLLFTLEVMMMIQLVVHTHLSSASYYKVDTPSNNA